ncbi:MAG TPA: carbamoyl-phosphate synthase (glutamine-hydrolyzing) large subunit [Candidatus Saccharimonadales bacterium]|nr:carbamoyl-phosphate synthase (glutamine-hydrolyzing) large subunit [Candidatus Saccharimonadales bacterium]
MVIQKILRVDMKSAKLFKKVIIFGSGGLRIGQAGEFDYSGSQAIKALKEEGIYTILINPNIATVQTDDDMADRVYFQPLNVPTVTKILEREKPDAVMLSFGGQTALNLGLQLHDLGIFKKLGITVLGTPVGAIKTTEDREIFKKALAEIGTKTARSISAYNLKDCLAAAQKIGYPIMLRSGFSLGGLGSGRMNNESELRQRVGEVLKAVPQVLIEEYLEGWKEIEYEVVRDIDGNTITVCNMENLDPMGIHTGESIVVAPSQTLTNEEYHRLRQIAIETINHLGIIGECNIQYALNPKNGDYRVIEVNARLSRSSALASKATGYPLAFVASKLMLGKRLHELKNSVTGTTSAFYEPALDYIAVKMPRWDLAKLKAGDHHIGSEMKSVGEVMALGRSFPEALQKAIRMLNIGAQGLSIHSYDFTNPDDEISRATDRRIFAIYEALKLGRTVDDIYLLSKIDRWFLQHIDSILKTELRIKTKPLQKDLLLLAKQQGFSDRTIGWIKHLSENRIRKTRLTLGVLPVIKQIDTLAGEFDAETNYLYMTYHGQSNDVKPLGKKAIAIIGSGPYCIGSSVEFDWCAVNTAKTLSKQGYKTVIINSNPETVSTDFDRSDRLYFEELTLERIQDIADFEKSRSIVVSVGGQIANNLALPLARAKYPIFGTAAKQIDNAEDRQKFSSMLNRLGVDQPAWQEITDLKTAKQFAVKQGYPLLIRPSYVLSGGAMNVVWTETELKRYLQEAARLSPDHPVVISQFIQNAKELEIDGVAQNGNLVIYAISEHIENAGVHSGDATVVYPAQRLYLETVRRAKNIARQVVKSLDITGPFNIQFIAKDNELKVIECNVRASRSFPFVSKVSGHNFIAIATNVMLGIKNDTMYRTLELDYVGVKSPQFSYNRLKGADPVAGVEMASTGEVACFGADLEEAFYISWLATEQQVKGKSIFISLPDEQKFKFIEEVELLQADGWKIYSTEGTYNYFKQRGIITTKLHKISDRKEPSVSAAIENKIFDLMVNVPSLAEANGDGYTIRRLAIDNHTPLLTNAETGRLLLRCLSDPNLKDMQPKYWREYVSTEAT